MNRILPDMLLQAYTIGVFPMAENRHDDRLFFVDPDTRGVIPLDNFHIPRSLKKLIRQRRYTITCDTAFSAVLDGCAEPTSSRPNTWINQEIRTLYLELVARGRCHSIEVWANGDLAGGLYGVALGGAFFGESMFSRKPNASKIALVHLVARLIWSGFLLLDSQFITDHLIQFGAKEISRNDYHKQLEIALKQPVKFQSSPNDLLLVEKLLQSSAQIS